MLRTVGNHEEIVLIALKIGAHAAGNARALLITVMNSQPRDFLLV